MNIFATNQCPVISAQDHVNVHNVKMIVESAQLLSTAHHEIDGHIVGYKPTHKNHPCAIWVRACCGNYEWAFDHFKALCDEYTFRTGRVHKSSELLCLLEKQPSKIVVGPKTSFAMAMPEQYQKLGIFDQTRAYQSYLNAKYTEWSCRAKPIRVDWGNRAIPSWVNY